MDTSKEYIKMCEKAEEIQKFWKNKKIHIEDIVYINEDGERLLVLKKPIFHLSEYGDGKEREHICFEQYNLLPIPLTKFDKDPFYKYDCGSLNVIWLPRQDQLQDLMKDKYLKGSKKRKSMFKYHENLLFSINCYSDEMRCSQTKGHGYCYDNSMEQLWLAFVMKEKFNKIWKGKEWIIYKFH